MSRTKTMLVDARKREFDWKAWDWWCWHCRAVYADIEIEAMADDDRPACRYCSRPVCSGDPNAEPRATSFPYMDCASCGQRWFPVPMNPISRMPICPDPQCPSRTGETASLPMVDGERLVLARSETKGPEVYPGARPAEGSIRLPNHDNVTKAIASANEELTPSHDWHIIGDTRPPAHGWYWVLCSLDDARYAKPVYWDGDEWMGPDDFRPLRETQLLAWWPETLPPAPAIPEMMR